jgi:tetratricopeptide (TPR) repeat protein
MSRFIASRAAGWPLRTLAFCALLALLAPMPAQANITDCDRVAAHPADPDKVLPGFNRDQIDLPKAIEICRRVLAEQPGHARTAFTLGRVLYYSRRTEESLPYLEQAAQAGYRQALFVLGFVLYDGSQAKRDDCRAAELWQKSIALEHPWTGYYLVNGYLEGRFDACGLKLSEEQIARYAQLSRDKVAYGASAGRLEALDQRLALRAAARAAAANPSPPVVPFDKSKYSQQVTECDRMAAHPEDPFAVAPGRERAQIDLPKAIEICREAVKADPKNPRLNYQYARVLGYSGRGAEGIANRQAAVDADYPQSLFVIGYITLFGMNQQPQDTCKAGDLLWRSARQQRMAGQLGFPFYVLQGRFDACPNVRRDATEMLGFIAAARQQIKGDYYQGLLADELEARLKQRP